MPIYHGTVDEALNVQNYHETIRQWTGLLGTCRTVVADFPRSPYTKYVFREKLQTSGGSDSWHLASPDDSCHYERRFHDAEDWHKLDGRSDDNHGGRRIRDGT
ncbi:PHB depolymerase family esterase [Colletotrichum orchidophilum]|uniref:PHB depolymerase family esterase n=1 Tax=Colletotrichum orchidophilum TaxID=1209926 RepID=A0A1G4BS64_9PEZI|nr:PHB depolymerase family esterase [Colletotrichum orchidophilum]OHF04231.1 PHB depolymerase family esterase [Colletotrichum orchidophilum]